MARQTKSTTALCAHPRLSPFAKTFLDGFDGEDPILAAQYLGQMAASWPDPRQRRRALAARIALLSCQKKIVVEETPEKVLPDEDVLKEVSAPQTEPPPKPAPPPKSRKTAKPAFDVKDAASMFDALSGADDDDLSDPDAGDGSGMGFSLSAPDQAASEKTEHERDLPSEQNPKRRIERQMPEESVPERKVKPEEVPVAPRAEPTMTDLSLAILTGEFSGPASKNAPAPELEDDTPSANGFEEAEQEEKTEPLKKVKGADLEVLSDKEAEAAVEFVPDERGSKALKAGEKRKASDLSALADLIAPDHDTVDEAEIIEE